MLRAGIYGGVFTVLDSD